MSYEPQKDGESAGGGAVEVNNMGMFSVSHWDIPSGIQTWTWQ